MAVLRTAYSALLLPITIANLPPSAKMDIPTIVKVPNLLPSPYYSTLQQLGRVRILQGTTSSPHSARRIGPSASGK